MRPMVANMLNIVRDAQMAVEIFDAMIKTLEEANEFKKKKGGHSNKLDIENMLFITLEYLREYCTYAAIAASYGLTERNAFTDIK